VTRAKAAARDFTSDLASGQYSEHYKRMQSAIRSYLSGMNVPVSLADLMFSVPPHRGRVLNRQELQAFMLDGDDPVYEQKATLKGAKARGISVLEEREPRLVAEAE
jgi:hypothetical protein